MRSSTWLVGAVCVLVVGLCVGLVVWSRVPATQRAAARSLEQQENERLRAEVSELKAAAFRGAVKQGSALAAVAAATRAGGDTAAHQPAEAAEEPRPLTLKDVMAGLSSEEQEVFLRELELKEAAARKARTLEKLRGEPRDVALQKEIETVVAGALSALDKQKFPSTRLASIECGTTLCKVEVDQNAATEQDALAGAVRTGMRTFGVRRGGPKAPPGETLGWTLFIAKKGERMPKVELEELIAMGPIQAEQQ